MNYTVPVNTLGLMERHWEAGTSLSSENIRGFNDEEGALGEGLALEHIVVGFESQLQSRRANEQAKETWHLS